MSSEIPYKVHFEARPRPEMSPWLSVKEFKQRLQALNSESTEMEVGDFMNLCSSRGIGYFHLGSRGEFEYGILNTRVSYRRLSLEEDE